MYLGLLLAYAVYRAPVCFVSWWGTPSKSKFLAVSGTRGYCPRATVDFLCTSIEMCSRASTARCQYRSGVLADQHHLHILHDLVLTYRALSTTNKEAHKLRTTFAMSGFFRSSPANRMSAYCRQRTDRRCQNGQDRESPLQRRQTSCPIS